MILPLSKGELEGVNPKEVIEMKRKVVVCCLTVVVMVIGYGIINAQDQAAEGEELNDILSRLGEFSLRTTLRSPGLDDVIRYEGTEKGALEQEFPLDDSVEVALVIAAYKDPSIQLSLRNPDDLIFEPEGDDLSINLEGEDGYHYQVYWLDDPEGGLWSISASSGPLKLVVKAKADVLLRVRNLRDWYPAKAAFAFGLTFTERGIGLRNGRFTVSMERESGGDIPLSQGNLVSQNGFYSFHYFPGVEEGGEYVLRVVAHGKTASGEELRREFRRRVWINPLGVRDLIAVGREEAERGNWDEAIDMVSFATQLEPGDIEAHRDLGFYYDRKSDSLSSAHSYEKGQLQDKAQIQYSIVDRLTREKARAKGWGVGR